jgi:hypothetical protein
VNTVQLSGWTAVIALLGYSLAVALIAWVASRFLR